MTDKTITIAIVVMAVLSLAFLIYSRRSGIKNFFLDFATPFATMSREMRRMNDLKELELTERLNPKTGEPAPVFIITEQPSRHDTEITYGVGDEEKLSLRERMVAALERDAIDEGED